MKVDGELFRKKTGDQWEQEDREGSGDEYDQNTLYIWMKTWGRPLLYLINTNNHFKDPEHRVSRASLSFPMLENDDMLKKKKKRKIKTFV